MLRSEKDLSNLGVPKIFSTGNPKHKVLILFDKLMEIYEKDMARASQALIEMEKEEK